MAEFGNPLASFGQGLQGGMQMALQVDQARQVRKQQEWETDFRQMSAGLNLADIKGISSSDRAKVLNESVGPIWKKWTGKDFPKISGGNPEADKQVGALVKDLNVLGKQAAEGKAEWNSVFSLANSRVAEYHAGLQQEAEVAGREKAAIDAAMAPIKGGYDQANKGGSKGPTTPDDILDEMFKMQSSLADKGKLDQQTLLMIGLNPESEVSKSLAQGRVSPQDMATIRGLATARMRALNEKLPPEKKLQEITPEEHEQMIQAGVPPEEIARRSYVVPGGR
jgi:hypothetical protein